jgi:hypothetical protein
MTTNTDKLVKRESMLFLTAREACNLKHTSDPPATLAPGYDVVYLWHPNDELTFPIPAIVLQIRRTKAPTRARFRAGPAVLWTEVDALRLPKRRRRR